MGSCLSRNCSGPLPRPLSNPPDRENSIQVETQVEKNKPGEEIVKKEIFFIKHRKSHDIDTRSMEEKGSAEEVSSVLEKGRSCSSTDWSYAAMNGGSGIGGGIVAKTSSCTKEDVDAILIQCGRLSRNPSTDGRKYSGSKTSYDFDNTDGDEDRVCNGKGNRGEDGTFGDEIIGGEDEGVPGLRSLRHRRRRRTPSRERDQQKLQQQRSGSRERGSHCSGRRGSRSPGRRSESPISTSSTGGTNTNPGRMISVPATVSSLAMNKSNNGVGVDAPTTAAITRIQVKRSACEVATGSRNVAASPRARSPARTKTLVFNENQNAQSDDHQQQPVFLGRSNSKKANQSPYRRNPLSDIDANIVGFEQQFLPVNKSLNNNMQSQATLHKPNAMNSSNNKALLGIENRSCSDKIKLDNNVASEHCGGNELQQQPAMEEAIELPKVAPNIAVNVVPSGFEGHKSQVLTRNRPSMRSSDLDINPEALLNPSQSYTALLLEDIQNFHQKSTPSFPLPQCLTKAVSILEAVANLNSNTSSSLSRAAFSEDRKKPHKTEHFYKNDVNASFESNLAGKKKSNTKYPVVESSIQSYVTMSRGTVGGEDMEELESSGSNSFADVPQHWVSSSSREPNSADSTDRRITSRSKTKEDKPSPMSYPRHEQSEPGHDVEELQRKLSAKNGKCDHQQKGIGRGRIGSSRVIHTITAAASVQSCN